MTLVDRDHSIVQHKDNFNKFCVRIYSLLKISFLYLKVYIVVAIFYCTVSIFSKTMLESSYSTVTIPEVPFVEFALKIINTNQGVALVSTLPGISPETLIYSIFPDTISQDSVFANGGADTRWTIFMMEMF